jgi:Domain of unknown function (DUF4201)
VRLRNISLRTALRKLERTFRAREQLADGLHMIDFEQLKIENQTLLEKIEERNEELAKLKRKKTTTVQVFLHSVMLLFCAIIEYPSACDIGTGTVIAIAGCRRAESEISESL